MRPTKMKLNALQRVRSEFRVVPVAGDMVSSAVSRRPHAASRSVLDLAHLPQPLTPLCYRRKKRNRGGSLLRARTPVRGRNTPLTVASRGTPCSVRAACLKRASYPVGCEVFEDLPRNSSLRLHAQLALVQNGRMQLPISQVR